MPPDDDFRRDRDPRTRRNARLVGLVVVTSLAAVGAGVWVARGQSSPTAPPGRATPSPTAAPSTPLLLPPTAVPAVAVLGAGFSAAYDAVAHQLVAVGGVDTYDTTWLWDGRRWTLARPSVSPPGRFRAAAAYDPLTATVMLYGGRLGPGQLVDDTWAWDGSTWRELDGGTGSPPGGEGPAMAWDDASNQMVMVGGLPDPNAGAGTWTWSGSHWMRQPRGDLPAGTSLVGMAFDPVTHQLIGVSCCAAGTGATSTLAWDGAAWRTLTTRSVPGFTVAVVRDPVSDRLLMFGDPAVVSGQEMWSWTGSDWSLLTGAHLPEFPAGAVTDTDTGNVVIVGSVAEPVQGSPQPVEVWSLTGTTWRQLG